MQSYGSAYLNERNINVSFLFAALDLGAHRFETKRLQKKTSRLKHLFGRETRNASSKAPPYHRLREFPAKNPC